MRRNRNSLQGKAVVIAGASSGVGRAAALAFARQGARVAIAARRAEALRKVAEECRALGGKAISVPTDVTDAQAVRRLADAAISAFGTIDVWINNAGTGAVGRFTETPIEAHRRVVEINLIGHINGAHAVLPHFLAKGRGVLINTNSIGAWVASPLAAAYAASKWGLRGFSESLDAELADRPHIHVCDIFPAFLDTPGLRHGANYTGRTIKPPPPVYDPQRVAEVMVDLARRPRRAVAVGLPAQLAPLAHALAPRLIARIAALGMDAGLHQATKTQTTAGNLFEPVQVGTGVHGGWDGQNRPLRIAGIAAAGIAAAVTLLALSRSAAQTSGPRSRGAHRTQ